MKTFHIEADAHLFDGTITWSTTVKAKNFEQAMKKANTLFVESLDEPFKLYPTEQCQDKYLEVDDE